MRLEVNGSLGSIGFDFEDMNFLQFYDNSDAVGARGFHRVMVTEPEHPYTGNWWPTGHGLGYEHGFTHQMVDLETTLGNKTAPKFPTPLNPLKKDQVLVQVDPAIEVVLGRTWVACCDRHGRPERVRSSIGGVY